MIAREISRFFEGVRDRLEILTQYRVEVEAHLARRFSFFHFIDFDENRMSDVFAYLLDPDGTHGQGDLFLGEFLKDVHVEWLPESGWSRIRVGREVPTPRIEDWKRRIDIEIAFRIDDDWVAIAIENKPWADDQHLQLSAYACHLESMYEGRFRLIYLTPQGENPSEYSITRERREELTAEGKLANASIRDWASANGWLKRAENEVKAERVRWFISDFRKALIESLPAQ